jgi:hypothetical protein
MPAPGHIKIRWTGVFVDAVGETPWEIWSMGIALGFGGDLAGGGGTPASFEALAQAMIPPWATRMPEFLSSQTQLTEVKASFVGADGKVVRSADGAFVQGVAPSAAQGGQLAKLPSQVSLAVTLDSAFKGAVGRGRFYLPGVVEQQLVRGQMSNARTSTIADAMKLFVQDVAAAAAAQGVGPVVIASGGSLSSSQPPALRPVVSIRVGSRLDVIRSRANALDEAYQVRPL